MNREELLAAMAAKDFDLIYKICTSQTKSIDLDTYKKEWDPATHDVMDPAYRMDKKVTEVVEGESRPKTIPVNRIPIPFQRSIVGKAVSFLFGNPVKVTASTKDAEEEKALSAVLKVLEDAKIDGKNREIARDLFRSTEVAEFWYVVKSPEHEDYGFKSNVRIRMAHFSAWQEGTKIYRLFDEMNDLIALCKSTSVMKGKDTVAIFEVFTESLIQRWVKQGIQPWILENGKDNPFGKIPGVYGEQEEAEWVPVRRPIGRAEDLVSNHGDINDYNGSPILVSHGKILSLGEKGERGKVIEIAGDGDLKYLSWDHAPASITDEFDRLWTIVHQFSQTPNFDMLKNISDISGVALRLFFTDAHLKVMDKMEIFDPYLSRRISVIKSILGYISNGSLPGLKTLEVRNLVTPFTVEDLKTLIDTLFTATGGKPFLSQKTATGKSGLSDDPSEEFDQLKKEAADDANLIDDEPIG